MRILIDLKTHKNMLEVEVCNQENMDKLKNEVANADIYNKLDLDINTDPNYNYEIFSKHLQAAKYTFTLKAYNIKLFRKKIKKFINRINTKKKNG